ncbi:tetratricopeptide repeat protein [bacterium]|nr:tetratricopeptide repeat protein [bacterium]
MTLDPQQPELYRSWGNLHQTLGEWQEAIACYQQGLTQTPGDFDMLHWLGQCCLRLGAVEARSPRYRRQFGKIQMSAKAGETWVGHWRSDPVGRKPARFGSVVWNYNLSFCRII